MVELVLGLVLVGGVVEAKSGAGEKSNKKEIKRINIVKSVGKMSLLCLRLREVNKWGG